MGCAGVVVVVVPVKLGVFVLVGVEEAARRAALLRENGWEILVVDFCVHLSTRVVDFIFRSVCIVCVAVVVSIDRLVFFIIFLAVGVANTDTCGRAVL